MANEYDHLREDADLAAGRKAVINEIVDEINSGNAHLLTRNELAEFVEWLVASPDSWVDDPELPEALNISEVLYDWLNYPRADGSFNSHSAGFAAAMAKKFFVLKGYEK